MTMTRRALLGFLCTALLGALPAFAQQGYPNKPIKLVVPWPAAGTVDMVGRALADRLGARMGQPVIVENKPGSGGEIGMGQVAKAKPDGYTILMSLSSLTVLPEADKVIGRAAQYQIADLRPIARFTADPTVLAVRADAPWKTYDDFIADARAHPGQINYGTSGNYGTMHMPMEMLAFATGIKMTHVPYTGAGPAIVGLLGGGKAPCGFLAIAGQPDDAGRHRVVRAGDRIESHIPGGGGYGDARKRDRQAVASDLRNGLISEEHARTQYGYEA